MLDIVAKVPFMYICQVELYAKEPLERQKQSIRVLVAVARYSTWLGSFQGYFEPIFSTGSTLKYNVFMNCATQYSVVLH